MGRHPRFFLLALALLFQDRSVVGAFVTFLKIPFSELGCPLLPSGEDINTSAKIPWDNGAYVALKL